MMALGGLTFLWEGQELSLIDAEVDEEDREVPITTRNENGVGRDATSGDQPRGTRRVELHRPTTLALAADRASRATELPRSRNLGGFRQGIGRTRFGVRPVTR